ncbi:MAG TPA: hypothetical protein VF631_14305 [Allosphingosinicella sp.]|jgi:hypothetical protein
MKLARFSVLFLMLGQPVAAERQSIGIFGQWGAFRERQPPRCFAIAQPVRGPRPEGWQPFASISYWPQRRVAAQVHFRMSRQKRQGSAILLRIDDRTFQLAGGGVNAWAPDSRADGEIVRALRMGVGMSIETRSIRGTLVRDYYQLRGAATAIDAAAIDCAQRR